MIPTDQAMPQALSNKRKRSRCSEMCLGGAIEATVYEEVTFIDQGQYCDAALCSFCGNRVAVDPSSPILKLVIVLRFHCITAQDGRVRKRHVDAGSTSQHLG